jgi:hypothetical protein
VLHVCLVAYFTTAKRTVCVTTGYGPDGRCSAMRVPLKDSVAQPASYPILTEVYIGHGAKPLTHSGYQDLYTYSPIRLPATVMNEGMSSSGI